MESKETLLKTADAPNLYPLIYPLIIMATIEKNSTYQ